MIPDEDEIPAGENPEQEPDVEIANAADPAQIAARSQKQRETKNDAAKFWNSVFATANGRREMWNILQESHAFEVRFACGPNGFPQPEATFFNAGESAFGLRLYQSWLLMEPEGVRAMHIENDSKWAKPKRAPKRKDD